MSGASGSEPPSAPIDANRGSPLQNPSSPATGGPGRTLPSAELAPSEVPTAPFHPQPQAPVIVAAAAGDAVAERDAAAASDAAGAASKASAASANPSRTSAGSPAMAALGGELVDVGMAGLVRVRFPVRREHLGFNGALSAGFLGAMLEVVVGLSAQAIEGGRQVATLEISTRFFRSIRTGHVVVDGTVLRAGTVTATIECVAWDDGGQLCAKATATNLFVG